MTNAGQSIPQTSSSFRRVWPVLKWLLFALVIVFVGRRAWLLWRDGEARHEGSELVELNG